jgi:hypothetical protein
MAGPNEGHRRMNEQMILEKEEQIRVRRERMAKTAALPGDEESLAKLERELKELKDRHEFLTKNP